MSFALQHVVLNIIVGGREFGCSQVLRHGALESRWQRAGITLSATLSPLFWRFSKFQHFPRPLVIHCLFGLCSTGKPHIPTATWGCPASASQYPVSRVFLQGITVFDTSVSGLGGCPYAPGASGNMATEDAVFMLEGMGVETGIDLELLLDASLYISDQLGRPPQSRVARAMLAKRQ